MLGLPSLESARLTPVRTLCFATGWWIYGTNIGDGFTGKHWNTFSQVVDNVFSTPPQTFQYDFYDHDYAGYIQDTWKARPNLTVNYGIRWDDQDSTQSAVFQRGCVRAQGPRPANPGYLHNFHQERHGAFQPRVGVAWNLRKNTVVRFGGGIFYGKTVGSAIKTIVSGAGESNINCTPTTGGSCAGLTVPQVLAFQRTCPCSRQTALFPGTLGAGGVGVGS